MYPTLKIHEIKVLLGLADEHLAELLQTVLTTYQPNFKNLTAYPELH
jgi:hypothetical protein